jgi:hypothetical protein
LASWQEDVDADIDQQSTLDLANHGAGDHLAFGNRFHHRFPLDDLFGLSLAQRNHAVGIVRSAEVVFHLLDQDFDDSSRKRIRLRFTITNSAAFSPVSPFKPSEMPL